ncbi:MAG: elongation factor G [Clostridia bacterium]|nr:elongation factor G [Clostridia bacterium]
MKSYQTKQIRNIAIVGHSGEGKTTLTEAMLYNAKAIDRMGKVENGTTVSDYDPEEAKRQISISASIAPLEWKDHKINVIDVPGYFDFVGEMAASMRVADAAVILVHGVSGPAVGTEKAWQYCKKYNLGRIFFVNNMDREHANFQKAIDSLQEIFGNSVIALQEAIMENDKFVGYIDILNMKAYRFEGKGVSEIEIPANYEDSAETLREQLMESVASTDEELMEKYFETMELSREDLLRGLHIGLQDGSVVPVLCGAAASNLCVDKLMDCINEFVPSSADRPAAKCLDVKAGETIDCACDSSAPFSALVFKTVADPFVGKLSLFKVMSGVLRSDMTIYNTNAEKSEKPGNLYVMCGKNQTTVNELVAGDIGAMAKLQYTMTGNTLCDPSKPVKFDDIEFPKPCISLAVSAAKQGEEDKVFGGLSRLSEEDPSFKVVKSETSNDTLICGQGELHIEIIIGKLKNKFGASAVLKDPVIPYRETIKKKVNAQGRHKKQTGGHGQFGDCWIEFSPITDGSADFLFEDRVVGGAVPRNFIPAVEKGLREAIQKGVLAGFPVVNLKCALYDGSYHPVDSNEMAFKTAASLAFKKGMSEANPVLLEPIYHVEIIVPGDYMGDVIGDMNRRRGRIMGMDPLEDGLQKIIAEVPESEMFKYATDLRSMTQARGSFDMWFERYEEAPANVAQKVIEQAKKDAENDD